nr:hypothetical protein [Tanacetum cinerariifolium]
AEELKVNQSSPFELENVEIELVYDLNELSVYVAVMDAILWCFCPHSLTLLIDFSFVDFEERGRVVKFTYEKLLKQEDQGGTNIQLVLSSLSSAQIRFSNLKSLLTALPRDYQRHKITFIK